MGARTFCCLYCILDCQFCAVRWGILTRPQVGDFGWPSGDGGACADNTRRKPTRQRIEVVYLYWDIFDDLLKKLGSSYFNIFAFCFLPGLQCEFLSVDINPARALFHRPLPLADSIAQLQFVDLSEQIFIHLGCHAIASSAQYRGLLTL
jgi:hypothetical protein